MDFTGFAPMSAHCHTTSVYFSRDFNFVPLRGYQPHKSIAQPAEPWPDALSDDSLSGKRHSYRDVAGAGRSGGPRAMLGWAPRRSELDLEIADAWHWMQKEPAR